MYNEKPKAIFDLYTFEKKHKDKSIPDNCLLIGLWDRTVYLSQKQYDRLVMYYGNKLDSEIYYRRLELIILKEKK